LYDLLFGYNRIPLGGNSSDEKLKVKLYNAMESDKDLNSGKGLDKGKGIDRGSSEGDTESRPLDKDVDRAEDPTYDGNKAKSVSRLTLGPGSAVEPYMAN